MMNALIQGRHGMNILGQGGKIILFTLPSLAAAIWLHLSFPQIAALPAWLGFLQPVGLVLLAAGILLWGVAIVQLLTQFPQGKLITSGAYRVVRNPIYASVAVFVLPGVSLLSQTWVYLVAALFLYSGVMIFIGKEEKHLQRVFGQKYVDYLAQVNRMVPFLRP